MAISRQSNTRGTMTKCGNCESHVTEQYAQVFAANDGTLHGCPECKEQGVMFQGAGAGLE